MDRYMNVSGISCIVALLLGVASANPAILTNPQGVFQPRSSESLDCNATITLDDTLSTTGDFSMTWATPNFPQPYSEDITCTLDIIFAESLSGAVMWVTADSRSSISASRRCKYDFLMYTSKDGYTKTFCDKLEDISVTEIVFGEGLQTTQFKFKSSSIDDSTDVGFELTISAFRIN